jgi:hypothetical protein
MKKPLLEVLRKLLYGWLHHVSERICIPIPRYKGFEKVVWESVWNKWSDTQNIKTEIDLFLRFVYHSICFRFVNIYEF